ncbi:MAG: site-2 protease family protein, partial [Proteobacteria bacterium]|nr:site-2 protease family protein [Pseudomonadota bacterium]
MWEQFLDISAWVVPVLTAIILHEVAHGWVAEKLGDPTARILGRITLNPLRHIDPVGTILFPAVLIAINAPLVFGSAKAVPVNFSLLRPKRLGMALVALAGPATNVLLALLSGLLLHIDKLVTPEQAPWLFTNLYRSLMLNCVLISFNLIPLLPLDGGRV